MANRHLSRSVVLQTLFEKDFNNFDNSKTEPLLERNINEFALGLEDSTFIKELINGVLKNQKKIDKVIEKAAPDWPLSQIAGIDRNVLRIGIYELLFGNKKEVPPKVAINEAIELAKAFGGESSGKFVNGVLGTIFGEVGEKKEKQLEESLAGAIIYRAEGNKLFFLFVHDVFGYWTLSKGHLEGKETPEDGAIREVKEEVGVDVKIEKEIGRNEYIASDPEKGKIKKKVIYFLASAKDKNFELKKSGGLDRAQWFKMEELGDLKIYDDIKPIIAKAIRFLKHV
ncbi:MAG: transcription antitermination factor NusB [Candidatus Parcubacteria bacterium]|nr:transcription antitermination factor NusB [Candidatus Parcubacteria bacterium]